MTLGGAAEVVRIPSREVTRAEAELVHAPEHCRWVDQLSARHPWMRDSVLYLLW